MGNYKLSRSGLTWNLSEYTSYVSFSADGKSLFGLGIADSYAKRPMRLWDVSSGLNVQNFERQDIAIARFSPTEPDRFFFIHHTFSLHQMNIQLLEHVEGR